MVENSSTMINAYTLGEYQANLANYFVFVIMQYVFDVICIWCIFVLIMCIFMSLIEIVYIIWAKITSLEI
jgi:hypothetical protein